MDILKPPQTIVSELIAAVQASAASTTPVSLETLIELRGSIERLWAWSFEASGLLANLNEQPPTQSESMIRHKDQRLVDEWDWTPSDLL